MTFCGGTALELERASTVRMRPVTITPRCWSEARNMETKTRAGSGTATPPVYPLSPSGRLPLISKTFSPGPRYTDSSLLDPAAEVVVRFVIETNGAGGPVMITHGAPTFEPGLTDRSSELSLTVSALTSAPYHHCKSSHSQPLPSGAPLK